MSQGYQNNLPKNYYLEFQTTLRVWSMFQLAFIRIPSLKYTIWIIKGFVSSKKEILKERSKNKEKLLQNYFLN